jgi:succinate dehydrogenase / fumarate reductase membrane anchor subunit
MSTATVTTRKPMPRNRWGIISWMFMRISALALVVLVLGHFAIQHVFNDVHNLNINFVAQRWASVGWRVYDALLLGLALAHGLNGLRIVADDYVLSPTWNRVVRWVILIIGGGLVIIGMVAIIGGARVSAS